MPLTPEQIEALNKKLDTLLEQRKAVDVEHKSVGDELRAALAQQEQEVKSAGAAAKETNERVAKLAADLLVLQNRHNELREAINEDDRKRGHGGGGTITLKRSAGESVVLTSEFKEFCKRGKVSRSFEHKVRGAFLGGYDVRASDLLDDSATGDLIIEQDDPSIIRPPERVPSHRQLFRVRPLTGTNSLKVRKRKRALELVTKVTAAQTSTNNTLVVSRLAGLSTTGPASKITVLNDVSGGPEAHVISALTPADADDPNGPGTITLTAALANDVPKGDLVVCENFNYVAEAQLRPKMRATYETVTMTLREWSAWVEATDEQLRYSPELRGLIDDDLREEMGRNEEDHCYNGKGTAGQLLGIFVDSDIPKVTWSEQNADVTMLDMVLYAVTVVETSHYMPTKLLVNTNDGRDLKLTKTEDGALVLLAQIMQGGMPRLFGLEVVRSTAVPIGEGMVGDFERAVTLYDGLTTEIEVGYINDQLTRGTKTILARTASEKLTREPNALCKIVWDAQPT